MTDNNVTLTGEVTDIFAHRFVIATKDGRFLADLGPARAEQAALRQGERVTIAGEQKPSEVKVHRLQKASGAAMALERKTPHDRPAADPKAALATVERNGFEIVAGPRRKPKHFEILGKDAAGDLAELHVDLDGELRKTRPARPHDPKWADEMRNLC